MDLTWHDTCIHLHINLWFHWSMKINAPRIFMISQNCFLFCFVHPYRWYDKVTYFKVENMEVCSLSRGLSLTKKTLKKLQTSKLNFKDSIFVCLIISVFRKLFRWQYLNSSTVNRKTCTNKSVYTYHDVFFT